MDVSALKDYLKNNEDKLFLLLEDVGFANINMNFKQGEEVRCAWEEGGNPTSVRIKKHNLSSTCFSRNVEGDIIVLIMAKLNSDNFPKTLDYIAKTVGYIQGKVIKKELPFGGFYKRIKRIGNEDDVNELEYLNEDILNQFLIMPSKKFLDDGISIEVQKRYQIGYDINTNRIIVPWKSLDGRLIGIMGRLNKQDEDIQHFENKWFPIIPFKKSLTLFGYSENYNCIAKEKMIIIGESEKFPQQLESKGIGLGLGLGGSSLSKLQERNIKAMTPNKTIVALDEGIDIEKSVMLAERLKMSGFFNNDSYYIDDRNGIYLPKGSKMSLSDLPKEDIRRLIKHCAKKV